MSPEIAAKGVVQNGLINKRENKGLLGNKCHGSLKIDWYEKSTLPQLNGSK